MLKILERKIRRVEATQPARRQAGEREKETATCTGYTRGRSRLEVGGIVCVRERGTTKES
jgi:hypothetical protein